mgnify:CR=1 FL=1
MTPGQWLVELQRRLGHSIFPADYIVVDVETTGRVFYGANGSYTPVKHGYHDLITQIGHCIVRGNEVRHKAGVVLDWTDPATHVLHEFEPMRDSRWLQDQLDFLERVFVEKGRTYQVPFSKMQAEGHDPVETLSGYYDIFTDAREKGLKFVGHNAWGFDAKMIRYHFRHYLGKDFVWKSDELIDTGMLEKAIQDADNENISLPWSTENLKTWSRRIANSPRAGIRWNLDQHVVTKYNLVERFNLNMDDAHDAGFDCYLTHLLLETLRETEEKTGVV